MKGLLENYNTDMGDAMISRACACFLSNAGLRPMQVRLGGGLNMSGSQIIRFVKSRERSHSLIEINDPAPYWGDLQRRHDRDRAILSVCYPGFVYRETVKGYSILKIHGHALPEAVCQGNSNQGIHYSRLLQLDGKNAAFLRQADPVVLTLRNRDEGRRTELEVWMQDEWSRDNWNF